MNAKTNKSASKKAVPKEPSDSAEMSMPSPVDQLSAIRDLLYGDQVRRLDSEILALTEKMTASFQALSDKLEQSLQQLNADFSSKLDDLGKHLEKLNKQRIHREDDLSADIDDLRHRLEEAQQASNQADDALHQELQVEADRLMRELTQHHNQAMAELEKTSQELSSNKADRKTLANLLASMADNLTTDEMN